MSENIKTFLFEPSLPLPENNEYSISIAFTGHDASVTIAKGREILEVMELERYVGVKNFDFTNRLWERWIKAEDNKSSDEPLPFTEEKMKIILQSISSYISRKYTSTFKYGIYVDRSKIFLQKEKETLDFLKFFAVEKWYLIPHHVAHAYGAFYQSPYNKALVITYDGASPDGCLNAFVLERNLEKPEHLFSHGNLSTFNCSRVYSKLGGFFGDIKYENVYPFLKNPGKIMGLAGYGKVNKEWKDFLKKLLKNHTDIKSQDYKEFRSRFDISRGLFIKTFESKFHIRYFIPIPTPEKRLLGNKAYNLAASLQVAFEENFFEDVLPLVKEYQHLPLCFSGGCAMNIILNTRIHDEWNKQLFVPPDPSDSGLSHGAMLALTRPDTSANTAYLGSPLLDLDLLPTYLYDKIGPSNKKYKTYPVDLKQISELIARGKIIGIARGRSEIGPRALGNRSIICSVAIDNMKNIINAKVKNREWFRPFAPVVRLESVNKYFYWNEESPYMSFCPRVKEEYLNKIKPIVHIDYTARVQTVTREQNEFLYDLLGEVEKTTGYDMLLNTSFNVDSKPIVNSIADVIRVLQTTSLDGIIIEDVLIIKNGSLA